MKISRCSSPPLLLTSSAALSSTQAGRYSHPWQTGGQSKHTRGIEHEETFRTRDTALRLEAGMPCGWGPTVQAQAQHSTAQHVPLLSGRWTERQGSRQVAVAAAAGRGADRRLSVCRGSSTNDGRFDPGRRNRPRFHLISASRRRLSRHPISIGERDDGQLQIRRPGDECDRLPLSFRFPPSGSPSRSRTEISIVMGSTVVERLVIGRMEGRRYAGR